MLCFFAWHSSCTAVLQKMSRILSWRSSCTAVLQKTNTKFYMTPRSPVSLSLLTCVVLVPLEDNRSKHLGQFLERVFIHAIHSPKEPPPIDVRSVLLPVQAPRLMNSLTWLGKQAMNDDRCDYCAQHEDDDSCCFQPLDNSLAIGRKSGALPRSRRRHQTRRRTVFSAVCHVPANIQATSAVECGLWYGVRRPYVVLVCRSYTDKKIAKKRENTGSKYQGPQ